MKLALLFSGQPRFLEGASSQSLKFFYLDKHQCDVYAHFWFSEDPTTSYITAPYSTLGILTFPSNTMDIFRRLYNPKKLIYEPPLPRSIVAESYPMLNDTDTTYSNISKYTSLQKVFRLVENLDEYDFIVAIRSDQILLRMPELDTLDINKIHVTALGQTNETVFNHDFNLIPPKFASFFYNYKDSFHLWNSQEQPFISENILLQIIKEYDLKQHLNILPFRDFNWAIQRHGRVDVCRNLE